MVLIVCIKEGASVYYVIERYKLEEKMDEEIRLRPDPKKIIRNGEAIYITLKGKKTDEEAEHWLSHNLHLRREQDKKSYWVVDPEILKKNPHKICKHCGKDISDTLLKQLTALVEAKRAFRKEERRFEEEKKRFEEEKEHFEEEKERFGERRRVYEEATRSNAHSFSDEIDAYRPYDPRLFPQR